MHPRGTSGVTWGPRPLGTLLSPEIKRNRTEEEQEKRNYVFFGKELSVPALAAAGDTRCIPPGKVCWIPPGQAELLTALLAIGQAPEATPRKNPVTGRIGRQKFNGKGVGNDTKRWWSWDRSPFSHH